MIADLPRRMGLLSASAVSIGVIFLMIAMQLLGIWIFTPMIYPDVSLGLDGLDIGAQINLRLQLGASHGVIVGVYTLFTAIMMSVGVWLITWFLGKSGYDIRCFLGLQSFGVDKKTLFVSLVCLVLLNVVGGIVGEFLQKEPMAFMSKLVTAQSLFILLFAVVVAAPLYEELMFRGLIFGVFANALQNHRYAIIVASVISSVLFALIHTQYDWYGGALIFAMGLVFCYARIQGSLALAMLLHVLNNLYAMLVLLFA